VWKVNDGLPVKKLLLWRQAAGIRHLQHRRPLLLLLVRSVAAAGLLRQQLVQQLLHVRQHRATSRLQLLHGLLQLPQSRLHPQSSSTQHHTTVSPQPHCPHNP
jgi:hypothetical protein